MATLHESDFVKQNATNHKLTLCLIVIVIFCLFLHFISIPGILLYLLYSFQFCF
jgi:hypothetical protein